MGGEISCIVGKQDTMESKTYINSSFQCLAQALGSSYGVVKRLLSACNMNFDYFRSHWCCWQGMRQKSEAALKRCVPFGSNLSPKSSFWGYLCEIHLLKSLSNLDICSGFRMISLQSLFLNGSVLLPSRRWWSQCMIMEKGISSVEVLPSKSSQVTAVKVVVKEPETKQTQRGKRVGFVLVHAGKMWE